MISIFHEFNSSNFLFKSELFMLNVVWYDVWWSSIQHPSHQSWKTPHFRCSDVVCRVQMTSNTPVWQNTTLSVVMSSDMSSAGLRRHPPHQCGKTLISVRWCRLKMSSCQASIFWVILLWNSDKYKFVLSSHNHGLVTLFWHHYDVIHTT